MRHSSIVLHSNHGEAEMIRQLSLMAGLFLTFCAASQPSRVAKAEVGWSAHPIKVEFQQSEPIIIAYELINRSKSELWVPKSIDPFVSVRLRVYDRTDVR